jgi:hypothetical protein
MADMSNWTVVVRTVFFISAPLHDHELTINGLALPHGGKPC